MKTKLILIFFIGLTPLSLLADNLKSIVSHVLDTNPIIVERFQNYQVTKSDIDIAKSGYYPTVDFKSSVGRKTTGRIETDIISKTYSVFQNSLILKQNLFNGFSTNEKINYQKMRTLSASYSYLSKANDLTLQVVNISVNLQREKALLANSRLNVTHNEAIYNRVQKAYKAGLSSFSEVNKIHASLALAKSNVILQKNKLTNALHRFHRVVGKKINPKKLKSIPNVLKIPNTQKEAEKYALAYSPSIVAGQYNVQGAKALYSESKSSFYPKIDVELSQNYNDNYNEFIGTDDRTQGLVVMSYNLYNGGSDEAKRVKSLKKVHQEIAKTNNLKKEVILNVQLAWSSYQLALEQIPFLRQYKSQSQKTLKLYSREYQLGKRSLLDLISAENDLKRANDELIYAKYGLLQSKYSIMQAMGLIMVAILGDEEVYYKRVGIDEKRKASTINTDVNYEKLYTAMQKETMTPKTKQNLPTQTVSQKQVQPINKPSISKPKKETNSFFKNMFKEVTKVRWESR